MEFWILCCLTTPGLGKDIRRQYDSYTRIKFFITSIIITYYHHFRDHVITFISITNILYFLIQVYFFEEGKNMGIITRC